MMRIRSHRIGLPLLCFLSVILSSCGGGSSSDGGSSSGSGASSSAAQLSSQIQANALELDDSSVLLYVSDDELYRINALSGQTELLRDESGIGYVSDVDVIGNSVFLTTEFNELLSVNLTTGEFNWGTPIGEFLDTGARPSAPVCGESLCYALGVQGLLVSIDGGSGNVVWSTDLGEVESGGVPRQLLVTSDTIYASTSREESDRDLFVLNRADGMFRSRLPLQYTSISAPIISGDMLILSTEHGVQAFDKQSFAELWRIDRGTSIALSMAVVVDNTVVFSELDLEGVDLDGQRIIGLDLMTGEQKWVVSGGRNDQLFSPGTDGTLIYAARSIVCPTFGSCNGNPMAIDPSNGNILWERNHVVQFVPNATAPGHLFYGDLTDIESSGVRTGVASLNPINGDFRWVDGPSRGRTTAPALLHQGVLYRRGFVPDVQP